MGNVLCRPPWAWVVWCGLRVKTARNRLNQAWHRVHRTCEQPNTGAGAAGRMTPQLQVARREVLGGVQRRAARRPEFRPRGPRASAKRIQRSIRIERRARGSQVAGENGRGPAPRWRGASPRRPPRPRRVHPSRPRHGLRMDAAQGQRASIGGWRRPGPTAAPWMRGSVRSPPKRKSRVFGVFS